MVFQINDQIMKKIKIDNSFKQMVTLNETHIDYNQYDTVIDFIHKVDNLGLFTHFDEDIDIKDICRDVKADRQTKNQTTVIHVLRKVIKYFDNLDIQDESDYQWAMNTKLIRVLNL